MILCDANNWMFRSHFAAPKLSSHGVLTGALHVGLSMLAALPNLFEPEQVMFLWDGRHSFRKNIMPTYKANRGDGNSEERQQVFKQMTVFSELLTAIGVGQLKADHLEADDLAGIITTLLISKFRKVTLISSDKDWFQQLGPGVVQIRGWKGTRLDKWTTDTVQQKFHVGPKQWAEYLALVGDKSDNIPNAYRGCGPVAAVKILQGKIPLPESARKQYELNLRVTRIRTQFQGSGIGRLDLSCPSRSESGKATVEDILSEYELFKLWGEKDRLWAIGGWGRTNPESVLRER